MKKIIKEALLFEERELDMTFTVLSIGRKWIKATSEFKGMPLEWSVEISDSTKDWEVGGKYSGKFLTKVDRSSYGTKRYAFAKPELSPEDQEKENQQKTKDEIDRWIGYIKNNIKDYWYEKGEAKVKSLLKALSPEEQSSYNEVLKELKQSYLDNVAPKEIKRWMGYIKDSITQKQSWYSKGEEKVLYWAGIIDQKETYIKELETLKAVLKDLISQNKLSKSPSQKQINLSHSYRSSNVGDIVELDNEFFVIKDIKKKFLGLEDAMSFGGNEDGYLITGYLRPATDGEIEEYKLELSRSRDFSRAKSDLRVFTQKNLSRAKTPSSVKEKPSWEVFHFPNEGFNIYGGGQAFALDRQSNEIWVIDNRGMDGDDWSRNNFRTGGAGAVATSYRWDNAIADIIQKYALPGYH